LKIHLSITISTESSWLSIHIVVDEFIFEEKTNYAPPFIYLLNRLEPQFDREFIASPCMDIHKNQWISKWISIKSWIIED